MKRFSCALLSILMILSLSGCGTASVERSETGSLIMAVSKEPASMIPYESNDTGTPIFLTQIYDRLLTFDETMNLVPCLAESWETIDDTHYRFHLREDVHFHHGEKLTTEDVLYSFEQSASCQVNGK